MTNLIAHLSSFVTHVISTSGYFGVAGLMAIESAAIPLPSEIIMPFAGYLAGIGTFSLLGVTLAAAIGSAIGSSILYGIGYYGGRPLIERYGRYIMIRHQDLNSAEVFFKKYGRASNFIGRLIPVIRTFISFPAGVAKVNFKEFVFFSFLGSFIWSLFLGYIGLKLGQNWEKLHAYAHGVDYIIGGLLVLAVIWYIYRHMRLAREEAKVEVAEVKEQLPPRM